MKVACVHHYCHETGIFYWRHFNGYMYDYSRVIRSDFKREAHIATTCNRIFVGMYKLLPNTEKAMIISRMKLPPEQDGTFRFLISEEDTLRYTREHEQNRARFEYDLVDHTLYITPKTPAVMWYEPRMFSENARFNCLYFWREFGHHDCMSYIMAILHANIVSNKEKYNCIDVGNL